MEDFMQLFFRSDVSYQTQYQNTDNPYSMNNYTPPKKKDRKKKSSIPFFGVEGLDL
jgi:hypothetical protein